MRTRSAKVKPTDTMPAPHPDHSTTTTTTTTTNPTNPDTLSPLSSRSSRKLTRSESNTSMQSQIYVGGRMPVVAYYKKPTLTISGLPEDLLEEMERQDEDAREDPDPRPKRPGRGRPAKVQKRVSPKKRRARQIRRSLTDVEEESASRNGSPSVASMGYDDADHPQNEDEASSPPANPGASPSQQLIDETVSAVRSTSASKPTGGASQPPGPRAKPLYVEEELEDDDLPPAFASDWDTPEETDIEDQADLVLKSRFDKMTDAQKFIAALTKHVPSERATGVLYAIAENTQRALKQWQDEYLAIDKRVAAHANNGPRKPVNGGRVPIDPRVFDDQKEADLYSYLYDARKAPGQQDPFAQRVGTETVGGRELRHRRARDVTTDDLQASEEEVGKRKRRAVQRFDGNAEPGSRTRKRDHADSATPEPQVPPRKRGRVGRGGKAQQYVPQRIREMRGESAMTTSASEDDHDNDDGAYEGSTPEPKGKRRGRPPGSKNLAQRKDAGIKKGPRNKKPQQQQQQQAAVTSQPAAAGQHTFSSAPSVPAPAVPAYQSLQQQQPFMVQGYTHAPPSNIPPASMAPVPGLNVDPAYASSHAHAHQNQHQSPFGPGASGAPLDSTIPPLNGHPSTPATGTTTPSSTPAGTTASATPTIGGTPNSAGGSASSRKKGVKSEKRSQSMTAWWAERKARRAAEAQQQQQQQQQQPHVNVSIATAPPPQLTTAPGSSVAGFAPIVTAAPGAPYGVGASLPPSVPAYTGPYPQPQPARGFAGGSGSGAGGYQAQAQAQQAPPQFPPPPPQQQQQQQQPFRAIAPQHQQAQLQQHHDHLQQQQQQQQRQSPYPHAHAPNPPQQQQQQQPNQTPSLPSLDDVVYGSNSNSNAAGETHAPSEHAEGSASASAGATGSSSNAANAKKDKDKDKEKDKDDAKTAKTAPPAPVWKSRGYDVWLGGPGWGR
ncbi:uncharacterized protein K452DRAFT_285234 [Aplosporella prunicola CBS 121167]|uniref:Uncharacterized protein n=1 Tax=Aplosporella prunicola CBS 121167 TaxID=1176127 RepID=A0A6A6BIS8_9PEZI|nr:uncharacterized protein K452DRAFT_285234 [Aplosporella prunicola CBS 121167]KAF2144029.1 hypothetical protein K452DRAFT_285234 [Aplosporella prunicola CBS 121167]